MKTVALLLARAGTEDVNCTVGPRDLRTPLHLASALGNLALVQLLLWVIHFPISLTSLDAIMTSFGHRLYGIADSVSFWRHFDVIGCHNDVIWTPALWHSRFSVIFDVIGCHFGVIMMSLDVILASF